MIIPILIWLLVALWGAWLGDAEHPRRVRARRLREWHLMLDRIERKVQRLRRAFEDSADPMQNFTKSMRALTSALALSMTVSAITPGEDDR